MLLVGELAAPRNRMTDGSVKVHLDIHLHFALSERLLGQQSLVLQFFFAILDFQFELLFLSLDRVVDDFLAVVNVALVLLLQFTSNLLRFMLSFISVLFSYLKKNFF
jgi:hypothetical protein